MTLSEWILTAGKTRDAVAVELGVHRTTLYHWLAGRKLPRPAMVAKIFAVTDGSVTANDLVAAYKGAAA